MGDPPLPTGVGFLTHRHIGCISFLEWVRWIPFWTLFYPQRDPEKIWGCTRLENFSTKDPKNISETDQNKTHDTHIHIFQKIWMNRTLQKVDLNNLTTQISAADMNLKDSSNCFCLNSHPTFDWMCHPGVVATMAVDVQVGLLRQVRWRCLYSTVRENLNEIPSLKLT